MARARGKAKLEPRAKQKSGPRPKAAAQFKAAAHPRAASQPKAPKGEHPLLRQLSKICLSLPETVRRDLNEHADFRVRGKVFAYFLNDHHGDGIISVCCKSALGENVDRASREPARFYLPPYIGPRGWFGLRLDGEGVDWSEVRGLLELSYELVAPKRLLLKK
jgi:predicted DNA-binding protein (MmcQ/YjbR family)